MNALLASLWKASAARTRVALPLVALGLLGLAPWAGSSTQPPRGSKAPAIELKDLEGAKVSTSQLTERSLVLVFGEMDHEGTQRACVAIGAALDEPRVAGAAVTPLLIVAHEEQAAGLPDAVRKQLPALILHDPDREAFGAYGVVVLPTVVVVDPEGLVVHTMPGFGLRFSDILTEALVTATGRQTPEAFEEALHPQQAEEDPEQLRADRLAHLGDELARHGLAEMAEARYGEAIRIKPGHTRALVGLAVIERGRGRLEEAESLYRSVLTSDPDHAEALLGLASVQVRRGGESLSEAEASVRAILEEDGENASAHFLLGGIYEERGRWREAAAEYKRAAQILLRK